MFCPSRDHPSVNCRKNPGQMLPKIKKTPRAAQRHLDPNFNRFEIFEQANDWRSLRSANNSKRRRRNHIQPYVNLSRGNGEMQAKGRSGATLANTAPTNPATRHPLLYPFLLPILHLQGDPPQLLRSSYETSAFVFLPEL